MNVAHLYNLILDYKQTHGKKPVAIYLGHTEWRDLITDTKWLCIFNSEKKEQSIRGIPIIEVNKENHFAIYSE